MSPFNNLTLAHLRSARILALLYLIFSACAIPAFAAEPQAQAAPDMIVFTNGDQLSGTMLRGIGDTIVFKSDMAGEITVPLARIKELRTAGKFAVLRNDTPITKKGARPGTIQYGDDAIKVSTAGGSIETVPVKQLGYIVDDPTYERELSSRPGFLHGWTGTLAGGATLVRSTQTGSTFTAGIALVRAIPDVPYLPKRNRTIFNLTETYGKETEPVVPQTTPPTPDAVAKTNIFHSDLEQDEYFSSRFFVLAAASFEHNFSQGLDLQEVYGGGIGWTVLQTPIQQFDLRGDIHYEKQYFQNSANDQNLIGATIAENYLRNLPRKIIFTESATVLPAFNNANAYSANFAAGLALPVFHRLSASFTTTDNFLNNPSAGFKKNSYQLVTGITYSLE